jgi:hypothetical protein
MALVPEGPTMRERPTIVCLHGGPGPDHTMLKPFPAPLRTARSLSSSINVSDIPEGFAQTSALQLTAYVLRLGLSRCHLQ